MADYKFLKQTDTEKEKGNEPFIENLLVLNKAVKLLFGISVLWKDCDKFFRKTIKRELVEHCHDYCILIKSQEKNHNKCQKDDLVDKQFWKQKNGRPVEKKCHAGIYEIMLPVYWKNEFLGTAYIGPYRDNQSPPLSPFFRKIWKKVPVLSCEELAPLVDIVRVVMQNSFLQRDALRNITSYKGWRHPAIQKMISCFINDARVDIKATEMATLVHISPSRLIHLCKEVTGMGFVEIRTKFIMQRALLLLSDSSLGINQVSNLLGFKHPNHFTIMFGKFYGCAPSVYRIKHLNQPEIP